MNNHANRLRMFSFKVRTYCLADVMGLVSNSQKPTLIFFQRKN